MATATRNPTSDEAVSGSWTGSAGTRYTLVDDYPDSGGTDKLVHGTTTAGNLTFGFSVFAIPAGSAGISIAVLYYDDKNASQACNVGGRVKVGGNYYNSATHNPANGVFTQRTDTWANNPKTAAAWTVDDINGVGANALQAFGWVSTDANPSIDLTSIQLEVTYTPPVVSLAAVIAAASVNSGALTVTRLLASLTAGATTVSGVLSVTYRLAAIVAATSTVAGALGVKRGIASVVTGASSVSAVLTVQVYEGESPIDSNAGHWPMSLPPQNMVDLPEARFHRWVMRRRSIRSVKK